MVCWVDEATEMEITSTVGGKFPVTFVKNFKQFRHNAKSDAYLLLLGKAAEKNEQEMFDFMTSHKELVLHLLIRNKTVDVNAAKFSVRNSRWIDGVDELIKDFIALRRKK
jgi:3-methyladenine DNA glycosylase AlkD